MYINDATLLCDFTLSQGSGSNEIITLRQNKNPINVYRMVLIAMMKSLLF